MFLPYNMLVILFAYGLYSGIGNGKSGKSSKVGSISLALAGTLGIILTILGRGRADIAADMLQVAQGGAIKTKIMHNALLSYPQLKEYLVLLTDSGLLEYVKSEKMYVTTAKGIHFLRLHQEASQMFTPKQNMIRIDTHGSSLFE